MYVCLFTIDLFLLNLPPLLYKTSIRSGLTTVSCSRYRPGFSHSFQRYTLEYQERNILSFLGYPEVVNFNWTKICVELFRVSHFSPNKALLELAGVAS